MSRDRLSREAITEAQARHILKHVAEMRVRWGKHYKGDDIGLDRMMDAMAFFAEADAEEVTDLREENRKLKLQLNASKAREAKLAKNNKPETE